MIFFAYDLDDYFDWRGFYYNYDELTPGPVYKTNEEIIDYIEHIDERFDREEVRKFKERFMSACDGHATDRIMEMFFEPSLEKYKKKDK
jgi:CDP-ribitol ribitolphosphotransferase